MPILVDITPTNVEFILNGNIYRIKSIIEDFNGKDYILIIEPRPKMEEFNEIIEPKVE